MIKQDSYSDFMPLRQSSLLTDETLPMNDTDVYANISTVWHAGFLAREKELERAERVMAEINAFNEDLGDKTLNSTVANSFDSTLPNSFKENDETLWMEALGCSSSTEDKHSHSIDDDTFYTALDFTPPEDETFTHNINFCDDRDQENGDLETDEFSLNDTLPMDIESLDDSF